MKILALETSCDETSAAIVEDGHLVHSCVIYSQIEIHQVTGGVVPEVAAREHPKKIWPVLDECLAKAGMKLAEIDALAATTGPGLLPALLTGYLTARTISQTLSKPFIPVHHTLGHIYANWLERNAKEIHFPLVVLTVSGGHNDLILFHDHFRFEILGRTRDDAAGEAFDKVARLLGLGYPGGPAIAAAAQKGKADRCPLPFPWLNVSTKRNAWDGKNFDFSFSGLKSAVRRIVLEQKKLTPKFIADCSASFQDTLTEVLATKLVGAAGQHQAKEVHLAGGVSANIVLREKIAAKTTLPFRAPTKFLYCTDNAAMIAAAAYYQHKYKVVPKIPDADPNLSLSLFSR